MIRIFRDYEIDGSDTSFYLMTDKKERIPELVKFILNLPIFDRSLSFKIQKTDKAVWAPHRDADTNCRFLHQDIEKIDGQINSFAEESQDFFINLPCQVTVLLNKDIKKELEQLTVSRPGGKRENEGMRNPEGSLERGASYKYVSINVSFKKEKRVDFEDIYDREESTEGPENEGIDKNGMVFNREAYEHLLQIPVFTVSLGCGPGFYYEYAAWIMNKIAEKFPDIGIDGGLDCGGAFTGGCTYANSIYAFERIDLPWKKASYAIEQLLHNLLEIYKQDSVRKLKKLKSEYVSDIYYVLVNPIRLIKNKEKSNADTFHWIDPKQNLIKAKDYQEFCDYLFSSEAVSNEEMITGSAIKMLIRPNVPQNEKMDAWQVEVEQDKCLRTCYIAACRKNGQRACEIWVSEDAAEDMRKALTTFS